MCTIIVSVLTFKGPTISDQEGKCVIHRHLLYSRAGVYVKKIRKGILFCCFVVFIKHGEQGWRVPCP